MIITESNIIPFKQYNAITLWPFIVFRKDMVAKLKATNKYDTVLRYEKIHYLQQREMLVLPFFVWYLIEWCIRLCMKGNAYRNISFEREAYQNENVLLYMEGREPYEWVKYIKS